ncbi:MAG: hypothetical protein DI637_01765 [Citromicrobium sp.]|nr:MAG: hypothetical protein DI637_01765 [Citromicrobium sp.]
MIRFCKEENDVLATLQTDLDRICWTRMQAESGQGLNTIVRRKEMERRIGEGLFFWGVGNAPARAIPALARTGATLDVVFSMMKSKPKAKDVAPAKVHAWRRYIDQFGAVRDLPRHVLVTSRAGTRNCHYALVCRSEKELAVADEGPFDPGAYRNFGAGKAVGASQTTALLERHSPFGDPDYRIAMRARMTGGMWVKLVDPVELSSSMRALLDETPLDEQEWLEMVDAARRTARPALPTRHDQQDYLFAI